MSEMQRKTGQRSPWAGRNILNFEIEKKPVDLELIESKEQGGKLRLRRNLGLAGQGKNRDVLAQEHLEATKESYLGEQHD
jgi:hypothetical protein